MVFLVFPMPRCLGAWAPRPGREPKPEGGPRGPPLTRERSARWTPATLRRKATAKARLPVVFVGLVAARPIEVTLGGGVSVWTA